MKVAFLTDLHLRTTSTGKGILPAQHQGLTEVCSIIEDEQPDLILCGGDLSGRTVPHKASIAERNAHTSLRIVCADYAEWIGVRGNHDTSEDYYFFNELGARHRISYAETPSFLDVPIEPDGLICRVWCWPWCFPSEAPRGTSHQEWLEEKYDAFLQWADSPAADINLLLAHGAVGDCSIKIGQPIVPTQDPILSGDEWMRRGGKVIFDAGFFGHYHDRQFVAYRDDGSPVGIYGGSLFVNDYGEEPNKGVTIWDSDAIGTEGEWRLREVKQHRKVLVTVTFANDEESVVSVAGGDPDGADIKFRVVLPGKITPVIREQANDIEASLEDMSTSLRREYIAPRIKATREGAAEIAAETVDYDKLLRYAKANFELTEEEEVRMREIFEEVSE